MKYILSLVTVLLALGAAHGETPCQLKRVSSIDVVIDNEKGLVAAARIGKDKFPVIIDTRLPNTVLFMGTVKRLGLPINYSNAAYIDIDSKPMAGRTTLPVLQLGNLAYEAYPAAVSVNPADGTNGTIGGVIGDEVLQYDDLEIDPATGHANLYSNDHCPGKVVYWAKEYYASDIHYYGDRQVEIDVELDGQPLHAVLDTGIGDSVIEMRAAAKRFGLDAGSPGMQATSPMHDLGNFPVAVYSYPFKQLKFGELTINNPKINVASMFTAPPVSSHITRDLTADMLIGMNFLRKLHIYIDHRDDKLYYTLAQ